MKISHLTPTQSWPWLIDSVWLPRALSALLLVSMLAKIWVVFAHASVADAPVPTPVPQQAAASRPIDLARLKQAQLFGSAQTAAPTTATAVKSRLNLRLLGIIRASDGKGSVAILAQSQSQRAYSLGESLANHRQARLAAILSDRVIIDVDGEQQFVKLEPSK